VAGTATASFDKFNLGGGAGGTTLVNPQAGTKLLIGSVTKSSNNTSQTLNLGGVTTGNEITGTISNGLATGANNISITKSNTSTWTLSGSNTYTGATLVTGGKLLVAGSINASASTINTGATLGGGGSVGSVTVNAGGTLAAGLDAAGTTVGTLTANGNVSFTDGTAHLALRLGETTASDADTLSTNSASAFTVSLNGADLQLTLGPNYSHLDNQLFLIINNANGASSFSGSFAQGSTVTLGNEIFNIVYGANYDASGNFVALTGGNDIALQAAAVPEPSTWAMIVGGVGMLGFYRKLRRNSSRNS